jgi:hypothetical protein
MSFLALPVWAFEFADTPKDGTGDNPKLSKEERLKKLQEEDNELYSTIFGKGVTKGKNEVTEEHLRKAQDERFDKTFTALRTERIHRVIREKAKAMNFMNPEDAVLFLSNSLTLNDELEIVKKDDNSTTTIDESLKQLTQMSPHLIGSNQKPGEGSSRPAPNTGNSHQEKPKFKRSQIRDGSFYRQHEAEILQAAKEGRIIED